MSLPVTVRLADRSAGDLRRMAHRERRSMSEVGGRFIEEGLRQERFPHIEFRTFNGERHACLKGRLQIWQAIMVARDYGMDVPDTASHLGLSRDQVENAIAYFSAYPAEIEQALEENSLSYEQLKEKLPALELIE